MTANEIVTGWNMVFVAAGVAAIASAVNYLWQLRNGKPLTLRRIWRYVPARLTAGFIFVLLGFSVRIGGWLPWRGMRDAGNWDMANWYADKATIWTTAGAMFCMVGLILIFQTELCDRFGKWALAVVPAGLAAAFVLGVALNWVVTQLVT